MFGRWWKWKATTEMGGNVGTKEGESESIRLGLRSFPSPCQTPLYLGVSVIAHNTHHSPVQARDGPSLTKSSPVYPQTTNNRSRIAPWSRNRGWTPSSRVYTISSIRLTPKTYPLWLDKISPESAGLMYRVRSLACGDLELPNASLPYLTGCFQDSLPSFFRLRNPSLDDTYIGSTVPDYIPLSSAFQHALASVSLGAARGVGLSPC